MNKANSVSRYSLFGESNAAIAPEFVHIETISKRSSLYEWTISPHTHPGIFQLLLLEAGSGRMVTDGSSVDLCAGSLVALPSGCVHAFHFAPDAEGWVLSIAADLLADRRIASLCSAAQSPDGQPRWVALDQAPGEAARLSWLLADFDRALGTDRAGQLADAQAAELALILALASKFLKSATRSGPLPVNAFARRRDDLVRRFREQVELHFRDSWVLKDYVRALGTTAPTLTRACREVLLKSPWDCVLDRLLVEAMRSLTYSTATVSQIAGNLGFADTAYFSRFFKSRTGMTASTFRQRGALLGTFGGALKPA